MSSQSAAARDRAPLVIYSMLTSHLRYGGESMALATLDGLKGDFRPLLLAPAGASHERARALGIDSRVIADSVPGFARAMARILVREREVAFLTTSVEHSLIAATLALALRTRFAHLHLAHGGPEPEAFQRKKWLNRFPMRFIAVSEYARGRLIHYGADPDKIVVIENFLDRGRTKRLSALERTQPEHPRRVLTLSRLQWLKRGWLVVEAIERHTEELRDFEFRVIGEGPQLEELRERAARLPNIVFPGFSYEVERELAEADILVHPCPVETFGLVVLEAMLAGVPVLVPDEGGAGDLVEDGVNGLRFRTDDPDDLAARLVELAGLPAAERHRMAVTARAHATTAYSQEARCREYTELLYRLMGRGVAKAENTPAHG